MDLTNNLELFVYKDITVYDHVYLGHIKKIFPLHQEFQKKMYNLLNNIWLRKIFSLSSTRLKENTCIKEIHKTMCNIFDNKCAKETSNLIDDELKNMISGEPMSVQVKFRDAGRWIIPSFMRISELFRYGEYMVFNGRKTITKK